MIASLVSALIIPLIAHSSSMEIDQAQELIGESHLASALSQRNIDALSDKTQDLISDIMHSERQSDITEAYNAQMTKLVASQQEEIEELHQQIGSIEETERAMLPFLNVMLQDLVDFVEGDIPFLLEERNKRLTKLKLLLDRADVSVAEKYRQILEAYLVEVEYGRTLESYSGVLVNSPKPTTHVNYLRMGRMALYYQSVNGQQARLWLPGKNSWVLLDDEHNTVVSKALRIAKQQRVPELLRLPVPSSASLGNQP